MRLVKNDMSNKEYDLYDVKEGKTRIALLNIWKTGNKRMGLVALGNRNIRSKRIDKQHIALFL